MIAVLADDLTGAAEIGGSAFRYGLTVEIQLDGLLPSDCEVIVIDTNTRSSSADDAATIVRSIATDVGRIRPELIYKKVDSVLRGHVAAELLAVSEVCGSHSVLMVNANPRKGRTVTAGELRIKGTPLHLTSFASDPEYPCRTSVVKDLLRLEDDRFGLAVRGAASLPDKPIIVGETASDTDLQYWAKHYDRVQSRQLANRSSERESVRLAAGGGEYFEAILQSLGKVGSLRPDDPMTVSNGSLLIRGSTVSAESDWPEVSFGIQSRPDEIARRVQSVLQNQGRAALQGDTSFCEQSGEHLTRLIEISKQTMLQSQPRTVWIEGGRTASSLVRACGWNRLAPIAVHGDGVVRLRVVGEHAPDLILKPGSYPWPNKV